MGEIHSFCCETKRYRIHNCTQISLGFKTHSQTHTCMHTRTHSKALSPPYLDLKGSSSTQRLCYIGSSTKKTRRWSFFRLWNVHLFFWDPYTLVWARISRVFLPLLDSCRWDSDLSFFTEERQRIWKKTVKDFYSSIALWSYKAWIWRRVGGKRKLTVSWH